MVIRKGSPEDGTTTAMRPLPGGARMYPETDIPTLTLEEQRWSDIQANLPLNREQRRDRLTAYEISQNQIEALIGAELDDVFATALEGGPCGCPPLPAKATASALLDNTREQIAEGTGRTAEDVPWPVLTLSLHAREQGVITREGILSRIHISEPTRRYALSYAVFCLKKTKSHVRSSNISLSS